MYGKLKYIEMLVQNIHIFDHELPFNTNFWYQKSPFGFEILGLHHCWETSRT